MAIIDEHTAPELAQRVGRTRRTARLPPLGKALQARGPGLVFVVPTTLAGWRMARFHPLGDVILLQLGHDPASYTWPVYGCEVVLYADALDDRTVDRMVGVLLRAGATAVSTHRSGMAPVVSA